MIKNLITAFIVSAFTLCQVNAQTSADEPLIITHITASGVNTVTMPPQLLKLLQYNLEQDPVDAEEDEASSAQRGDSRVGYRVQVFSDNNQRTAKNEARSNRVLSAPVSLSTALM